ncbi:methylated-DNA--[protein]-cysteine S-methyltransferase [Streptomyces sp. H10-C2]|uniref:methylated-DNA--[protein]-cysteine S-methyltransferase n=1 Tax=unclassified Streptomyces TaxID=2593676 RepID=UPI0024B8C684|nr:MULTISPECIES: methylated-DNA--[protein]-cysteine S-methyltransferase [unclassified Streptomyces]MDJ0343029.1 methylated-DNA--[protein]-cysteine S-methyltransferase [Streptomyces sp. PH10-H1]MDJ0372791.1 methylated-DNA--[protein]-cysteine S-methyltransferase [Streptomyces sp. H10-C2]
MTLYSTAGSPLGDLLLVGEKSATARGGIALASLSMQGRKNAAAVQDGWQRDEQAFTEVTRQLRAYFAGGARVFDLEFVPGGSAFQQRVWEALDDIPYGTTTTYGRLSDQLGIERAEIRAVGAAVGANPLLLVRPCHRVIGADGTMRGYAGGVGRKQDLLIHEGALQPVLI